jgi:pyruvate dehydrogenase E2 component (dihydrolipoamide acetyltransferase)
MATPITMPKLGLSMKTGKVNKWLKSEGDRVKKGEFIVEISTEKITNKVASKVEGVLLKIVAPKNSVLPVGALLCVIGEPNENIDSIIANAAALGSTAPRAAAAGGSSNSVKTPEAMERIKISPAARKLAEENGIDYSQITGTGPEGRITKEDVEKAIEEGVGLEYADDRQTLEVIPYEGMRRVIGENMARSSSSNAMVAHHVRVDISGIFSMRAAINAGVPEKEKISMTAIITKAVARAHEVNPCLNASLVGDEIRVWKDINIGMAVAIPGGLVVPVIRDAHLKRLKEVNKEIADLAKRARRNKLGPDDMSGGTFTITNLGSYGSVDFFTPIINPPETAILGLGRTVEQPAVVDGQIVVRPMMGLSLVFDHRVVDGAPAAEWLALLIRMIENPTTIFI